MSIPREPMTDAERESAIAECARRMEKTRDPQVKRAWWDRLRELHLGRSLEQVARLEREQGLRK